MFTCSSVTLWKTVKKMKIRLNFYFRVVKWEVSSRGIPLSTPSGSWGAPCFRPIILQLENRNSSLISFSSLFSKTVTDKQVNKGLFPVFHFRSLCENQVARCQRKTYWQEEKDNCEECQSKPLLQWVFCLHGRAK